MRVAYDPLVVGVLLSFLVGGLVALFAARYRGGRASRATPDDHALTVALKEVRDRSVERGAQAKKDYEAMKEGQNHGTK